MLACLIPCVYSDFSLGIGSTRPGFSESALCHSPLTAGFNSAPRYSTTRSKTSENIGQYFKSRSGGYTLAERNQNAVLLGNDMESPGTRETVRSSAAHCCV